MLVYEAGEGPLALSHKCPQLRKSGLPEATLLPGNCCAFPHTPLGLASLTLTLIRGQRKHTGGTEALSGKEKDGQIFEEQSRELLRSWILCPSESMRYPRASSGHRSGITKMERFLQLTCKIHSTCIFLQKY